MKITDQDRWEPILKGETYCSLACGCKCSKAEHGRAVEKAKELAGMMGPGWKPRVWENGGWHFDAEFELNEVLLAEIHDHHSGHYDRPRQSIQHRYWVVLRTNPNFSCYCDDAKEGLASLLEQLDQHAEQLRAVHHTITSGSALTDETTN